MPLFYLSSYFGKTNSNTTFPVCKSCKCPEEFSQQGIQKSLVVYLYVNETGK